MKATIYKINLNIANVQDTCLHFEGRNIINIEWSKDFVTLLVQDI